MKKLFAILLSVICITAVFSACDTQERCAAYGHYTYNEAPVSAAVPVAIAD